MIGNIPATAPLWKGASQEALFSIIADLSSASYHFAAENPSEMSTGYRQLDRAARKVNELGLGYQAMLTLYNHSPQLIGLDAFFDAVLKAARSDGHDGQPA